MRIGFVASIVALTGCVTSGVHQAALVHLGHAHGELEETNQTLETERAAWARAHSDLETRIAELIKERDELSGRARDLDERLTAALGQNQQLVTKVSAMGQSVEQLLGEKDSLAQERERMERERRDLAREVEELKRMRAAAEAREREYRTVLDKLRKMIDAGTLAVKVRGGRMVVQMSSDVVFPPGATRIKTEAREAIIQLAETIKQFPDRKFQVVGHSDSTPIRTERFPSNWELSSQRAIEVVRLMVEAGVPAEMLSAAGNAEFDPMAANDTPENKTVNRRVEIVFMPKLDELPGFEALSAQ